MNKIEQWYDEKYDEWDRLERHKIEFDITKRYTGSTACRTINPLTGSRA